MTGAEAVNALALLGVRVSLDGQGLKAGPAPALTAEARRIIKENREALIFALSGFPDAYSVSNAGGLAEHHRAQDDAGGAASRAWASDPAPSTLSGYDCSGCDKLEMLEEARPGTRRRFFWHCRKGHELLQGRNYGERIIIAPPDCQDFTPWKAGTQ